VTRSRAQARAGLGRSSVLGFTLLEVMVSMAILAVALGAVFSAEAGSVRMAGRARKLGFASMLVRCKMGEIEEQVAKEGFPAMFAEGDDKCCKDAEIQGFTCKWEIEPVVMPDAMFNPEEDKDGENADDKDGKSGDKKSSDSKSGDSKSGTSKSGDSKSTTDLKDTLGSTDKKKKLDPAELFKDPKKLLGGGSTPGGMGMGMGAGVGMGMGSTGSGSGKDSDSGGAPDMDAIASMAMQYVYPILKPAFESQIRRATVTVMWNEGSAEQKFDVTQYLVAEQPIPLLSTDPNAQNQNGTGTGTGTTGTGTGTGTGTTGTGTGTTNGAQPGLFQPRTSFGNFGTSR
jgi:prepilin-type N-terminal cleavage/methylation domain-containing protein